MKNMKVASHTSQRALGVMEYIPSSGWRSGLALVMLVMCLEALFQNSSLVFTYIETHALACQQIDYPKGFTVGKVFWSVWLSIR